MTLHIRVPLSSADTDLQRAANLLRLVGLGGVDPDLFAWHAAAVADALACYRELDAEAGRG